MTAYVIFIREQTHDQRELDIYSEKMGDMLAGLPVTVLSAYGRMEVFEGDAPEGVVLVSFPTLEQAKAWYHGDAYQAVVGHRHKGATYRGFVVEGLA
ncbi:DUF1330 domain-containing protein [Variovorax sp. WS11]|uniref:DUF1330 domain-containing protein n=1 Tax=Variovorax sp. WS11 TaxID=1105204 RepID=UPI000D0D43B0|nr:DUF1330 domain-containing protein [Variovorax sp. WS11]NDZ18959.1 DUF1330 domain-containing protein [Variovorax sp. WS11]PSL82467.1 DUF1330 domain-containing protein [Variovorax sp. WS11]